MATLYAFGIRDDPHIVSVLNYVQELGVKAIPVTSWSADPSHFQQVSWSSAAGWSLDRDCAFWLRDKHAVGGIDSVEKQDEWWSFVNTSSMFRAAAALGPLQFNRTWAAAGTDAKIPQLSAALEAGFDIPPTIVSNSKADILAFIAEMGPCIVKPLSGANAPAIVGKPATARFLATVDVSAQDISRADEESIRLAPSIFQGKVIKDYELRTIVFGDEIVSFRLDSQGHHFTELDWRIGERLLNCEVVETPRHLVDPIMKFMNLSCLDTTVFDFAVKADGSAIFFESNPAGQWRRMDYLNDDIVSKMFARQMVKAIKAKYHR